jgi:hypothetical protein
MVKAGLSWAQPSFTRTLLSPAVTNGRQRSPTETKTSNPDQRSSPFKVNQSYSSPIKVQEHPTNSLRRLQSKIENPQEPQRFVLPLQLTALICSY